MRLLPGFADPVAEAQQGFRAILTAMSRPGRIVELGQELCPPTPLNNAAAAALLTLADAETTLWHDAGTEADHWLRFHCGSPRSASLADARFVLATGDVPSWDALDAGTDEAPELGATLILQVNELEEGRGWLLSGPGIEHQHRLHVGPLPCWFAAAWAGQRAKFPCGIDVLFCAGDRLAALPRSITVREG